MQYNKPCTLPTLWAKKLIKLDDIKIFDLKKGNRDRVVS